jgi:hypothetical protein
MHFSPPVNPLPYSLVFDDNNLDVRSHLKGIPKMILIEKLCWIANYHLDRPNNEHFSRFLGAYFRNKGEDYWQILWRGKLAEEKGQSRFRICYVNSCLKISELVLGYAEDEFEDEKLGELKQSERILRAILVENEKAVGEMTKLYLAHRSADVRQMEMKINLSLNFGLHDLQNSNPGEEFVFQVCKGLLLFRFMQEDISMQPFFGALLSKFNCQSEHELLMRMMRMVGYVLISKENNGYKLKIPDTDEWTLSVFTEFSLSATLESPASDFLSLRSRPVYQESENEFHIFYFKFLMDKLYNGWYFSLREINDNQFKDSKYYLKNLRQVYSKRFSEEYLASFLLKNVFLSDIEFLTDTEIISKLVASRVVAKGYIPSTPDFLAIEGNNFFLFEVKDNLVKADEKVSTVYESVSKTLMKNLNHKKDANDGSKGIQQLIEFIELGALTSQYSGPENATLFPVLILCDESYNAMSLNELLNDWFQQEYEDLKKRSDIHFARVNPLCIITINSLLIATYYVKSKKVSFAELLSEYSKNFLTYGMADGDYTNHNFRHLPFSSFIRKYSYDKKMPVNEVVLQSVMDNIFEQLGVEIANAD